MAFFALLIRHETLAGDYENEFVLVIVPFVLPGGTFPDHNVRGPVMASHQNLAPRCGLAAQNPSGRKRP